MPDYQCTMCSYKFVGEKMPLRCPYCAAKGAVTAVQDAQTLLNDAGYVEEDIRKIRMSRQD
jgi:predicted Zn-ribbon and HTH transcriptional regulator